MTATDVFWLEEYRKKARAADPLVQSGRRDGFEWIDFLHVARQMFRLLDMQPTHELLDVGCANGLLDILLSASCRSLLAVEPVEELAALARDNLAGCPNVRIEVAPGDAIPCEDGRFDRALALEVMQLLPRDEVRRVFEELRRVVHPGGRIVIGLVPDARRKDEFLTRYLRSVREAAHLSDEQKQAIVARNEHAHWHDADRLMAWWRELGGQPARHPLSEHDPAGDHRYHLVVDVLM